MEPYIGRWIAQDGLEVLYDADSPYDVVRWLRTNGLRATVWKVPTLLTVDDHSWEAEVGFCDPWPHGWGLLGQRADVAEWKPSAVEQVNGGAGAFFGTLLQRLDLSAKLSGLGCRFPGLPG